MVQTSPRTSLWLRHYEFFIFSGLICWLGIIHTLQNGIPSWPDYLRSLALLGIAQSPVLIFSWYKDDLQQNLTAGKFLYCWLICFLLLLPGFTIIFISFQLTTSLSSDILVAGIFCSFALELLFVVNRWYQNKSEHSKWLGEISVEGAVLAVILFIAFILAAMAASSLGNPLYDLSGRLLIGPEFGINKIVGNFGRFLTFFVQFTVIYCSGYLLFYINSRFLIARVFKQKGLIIYLLSTLAVIAFLYPLLGQILLSVSTGPLLKDTFSDNPFSWENAFAGITIMFLSLPVLLALQWARQNNQIAELEKERARTELDLLKQQINPHFFFNTLNNLYALSLRQSDRTPESILQLSELMRYVIYKGQQPQVNIAEEVKYIRDYMELQQLRMNTKPDIHFQVEIADVQAKIAPLLLIIFVENAFKHGVEPAGEAAFLHIRLNCSGNQLCFFCQNSVENDSVRSKGIGLGNLERRLTLLYPGKFKTQTELKNDTFTATLELDLS